MNSPITTHVLDTSRGAPAAGIAVRLDTRVADAEWHELGVGETDADGRVSDLLNAESLSPGTYRLTFATGPYLSKSGMSAFFPVVRIEFAVNDPDEHYHVPLLLSPFGYSTYRGS